MLVLTPCGALQEGQGTVSSDELLGRGNNDAAPDVSLRRTGFFGPTKLEKFSTGLDSGNEGSNAANKESKISRYRTKAT